MAERNLLDCRQKSLALSRLFSDHCKFSVTDRPPPRSSSLLNPWQSRDSCLHLRLRLVAKDVPSAGSSEAICLKKTVAVYEFILTHLKALGLCERRTIISAPNSLPWRPNWPELRERIDRSSRNSFKSPSSDSPGFKPPWRGVKAVASSAATSRAIPALA